MGKTVKQSTAKTESLIPYARNSRTHSDAQVAQIAASIKEFGFLNPIIVDGENGIIAGHGRLLAAQKLGIDEVPIVEAAHLTEAQKRAYVIADNKLALNAGWDEEMLAVELGELSDLGFDLGLTGFQDYEIDLIKDPWESDAEAVEKHGEHMDGIQTFIRVLVDQDAVEIAKEAIEEALTAGGVEFEIQ